MKKWMICLMVLALLGFGVAKFKAATVKTPQNATQPIQIEEQEDVPESSAAVEGLTINVTKEMVYQGDLLLVNKDHPVPKGLHPETEAVSLVRNAELIDGFGVLDNQVMLSPRLAERFGAMVKAAGKEGINHFLITSGYRDEQKQDELYREMGSRLALPAGYSEHNLGLSLDIGSSQAEMNVAPEGQWLKENAWKHGFILRYPEDKTAITGIQFEPWHFRYVGLPHSAIIQENGFVLEQYLDYLKEQKSVSLTVQGQNYHVFYYPVSKDRKLRVPAQGEYETSGNNMDGVIVTVRE